MKANITPAQATGNYANVNGIKMYYEMHGTGAPLVLIHGGGSTLGTSFGRVLPYFAKTHQVIAVELQNHGHTDSRNEPETFKQDADDVAELLTQLHIPKADILGFSNGGQTSLELGIRYADKVNKLVIASAFYKRSGVPAAFWDGFAHATLNNMPKIYQDEFLKINNSQDGLLNMFNKDAQRMANFKDWSDDEIRSIKAPSLVLIGDRDLTLPEHAVEMYRLLPKGHLAILPGTHGSYMGEAMTPDTSQTKLEFFVETVNDFLTAN